MLRVKMFRCNLCKGISKLKEVAFSHPIKNPESGKVLKVVAPICFECWSSINKKQGE